MRDLILFGTEANAEVFDYYFTKDSDYNVKAFTVDAEYVKGASFCGKPVIPFEEIKKQIPPSEADMFIAVGFKQMNAIRARKYTQAKSLGYRLASHVSSRASVWQGLELNDNSFIMEHNTVQPFVTIGANTIVWSGNHIGHHAAIGDNCFVSSQVVISGRVTVGDFSFLGVNSTIRDGVRLGEATMVGAGCLVLSDTPNEAVLYAPGSEVRKVSSRRLRVI